MTRDGTTRAIYPGSFDPLTNGHEDIIRRALVFADHLIVAVAHRATHVKQGMFPVAERIEIMREVFGGESRIEIVDFQGLLVEFARQHNARIIIRGLRAVTDFDYEFQMALMNRSLWPDVETIFLAPDVRFSFLSASLVREIASLDGDVSEFVRPEVAQRLKAHIAAPER